MDIIPISIDDGTSLILESATEAHARALALPVSSDTEYRAAGEELRLVKSIEKSLDDARKTLKAPVLDLGRRIDGIFNPALDLMKKAEAALKRRLQDYTNAQEKQRAEEARRVRAQLEAEDRERRRLEDERRREEQAAKDFAGFGPVHVPEPLPEPARTSVVMPSTTVAKAEGISTRKLYRGKVTDKLAVIRAAAAGDELALALLVVDERALATLATSRKGSLSMPGVVFTDEDVIAARSL